jgi:hypothetical protein
VVGVDDHRSWLQCDIRRVHHRFRLEGFIISSRVRTGDVAERVAVLG